MLVDVFCQAGDGGAVTEGTSWTDIRLYNFYIDQKSFPSYSASLGIPKWSQVSFFPIVICADTRDDWHIESAQFSHSLLFLLNIFALRCNNGQDFEELK